MFRPTHTILRPGSMSTQSSNTKPRVSLTELSSGQSGTVVRIRGGWGVRRRLQALGIRPGARVTRISAAFGPGAVVVASGGGQAALGYGVARKVIVEGGP